MRELIQRALRCIRARNLAGAVQYLEHALEQPHTEARPALNAAPRITETNAELRAAIDEHGLSHKQAADLCDLTYTNGRCGTLESWLARPTAKMYRRMPIEKYWLFADRLEQVLRQDT